MNLQVWHGFWNLHVHFVQLKGEPPYGGFIFHQVEVYGYGWFTFHQCSSNVVDHRPISVCPLTVICHIISTVHRVFISLPSNSPLAASRWLNLGHNSTRNLTIVSCSYTTVYQLQHTIVLSLLQGQTSMEKTLQPSTQDLATTHPYLTLGISASVALYWGNSTLDKSSTATSD